MARLRNPFDEVNLNVLHRLVQYKKRADKARPVPAGQEKVDKRTFDQRVGAMSRQERQQMLDGMGMRKISDLLEGKDASV